MNTQQKKDLSYKIKANGFQMPTSSTHAEEPTQGTSVGVANGVNRLTQLLVTRVQNAKAKAAETKVFCCTP
jgi:hypothetical protein